jgi:uncharacterized protein YkwD
VGENIAKGYSTFPEALTAWKNSIPHCVAMMDSMYTEVGIGEYKTYWVMDLGE